MKILNSLWGIAIALALAFACHGAMAQFSVSGKVTDGQTDEPLVGANVMIKGTTKGMTTDTAGNYQIKFSENRITLQVSYAGYKIQNLDVRGEENVVKNVSILPISLEEVVIKSVRADVVAPVSQKTITRKDIEEVYVGQDALFVLEKTTPSIIAYSESGTGMTNYGQMRLRGMEQKRINITLNGIPLNDMIDQGVYFSNFTDFGNSIESVQVQRGVGTSTNGTASYAGSINFESISLEESDPGAEVQFTAGSFDTYRGSAEFKTGLMENKLAFYGRFSQTKSNGYRHHSGTDSYSFFLSGGYFGEKDLIKITAFTGRTKNDLAYAAIAEPDLAIDPKTNYISENDIDDFGQQLLQLQYTRKLSPNASLVSSLYYGGAGGDFPYGYNVIDSTYSTTGGDSTYLTNERFTQINYPLYNRHYGLMSNLNFNSPDGRLNTNVGIHLYTFRRQDIEQIVPQYDNPYYDDKAIKNELSLFGKASYELGKLTLYGDLQVRTVSLDLIPDEVFLGQEVTIPVRKWTFVNPKIGFTYQLNNSQNLYISYGRSGREPTRTDVLGATQINIYNLESARDAHAVKPEYVNDLEAGFRLSNEKLRGQVNVFYMQFENEIADIGKSIPEGFIQLRKNVPSSYRSGIELDWTYQLLPALTFGGNATYMQSVIKEYAPEDDEIVYRDVHPVISPNWMINAALTYELRNVLTLSLNSRYVSESFLEPTNQPYLILPSYFVLDSKIAVSLFKKHEFSLHLNNLFNKQYYAAGQPVDYNGQLVPGYFIQPLFHFYAMLDLKF